MDPNSTSCNCNFHFFSCEISLLDVCSLTHIPSLFGSSRTRIFIEPGCCLLRDHCQWKKHKLLPRLGKSRGNFKVCVLPESSNILRILYSSFHLSSNVPGFSPHSSCVFALGFKVSSTDGAYHGNRSHVNGCHQAHQGAGLQSAPEAAGHQRAS